MNIIRKTRRDYGLTLRDVAEQLELPILVYLYYEFRYNEMRLKTYKELCDLLHLDYKKI